MAESKQVAATVQLVWSESDKSFKNQLNNQLIPTRLTEYDLDGRMSAVALPAVADPLNANAVTRPRYQYGYSLSGQQSLIVDPYGHETRLAFDAFGRQVSRTLPLGFGVDGKLGTTDDSAAEAFSEYEQYDSRGRKSLHISFEGVHEQNIYDDKTGRLTEIRYYPNASAFAKGTSSEVRKFSFDNRGRTNKIEHFVGGVSVRIETMAYDDEGKLYETMNREGKVRYTYDVHGRMTRKEWSSTAFMPTSQHAFENTLDYTYDELGRLKTVLQRDRGGVTLGTSDVTAYRYTLDGLLDTTRYHNGLIHDNDYDSLGRLKKLTHWVDLNADGKQQSSENRATFDYTVRADGKRTKVVESIKDGTTPVVSNEFIWEYDAVDRLISETLTDQYDLDWIYDLAGNRRTQTKSLPDGNEGYNPSEQTTYVYDSNDRLITETKTVGGGAPETNTYEYNKTQQHIESGTVDGIHTSQTFEYNLQGLLESVSVIKSNSAIRTRTSYEYDSTGTRTSSARFTRDSLGSGLWEIASRTEFLTDSENHTGYSQVLQETTYEGGVATKKVIFTVGHDQISQSTLAREAGTETWSLESDAWFGTDGHGSVRVLYDFAVAIAKDLANAARLQVYTFDAYGNLLSIGGQQLPTSNFPLQTSFLPLTTYLYSGESFDFKIGQQYLRARFYDATTGRFNRLDPFFGNSSDPQSFHKYAYVHGDPVQGIDPTGEFIVSLAVGFGISSGLRRANDFKSLGVLGKVTYIAATIAKYTALVVGMPAESALYFSFYAEWMRSEEKSEVTGRGGLNVEKKLKSAAKNIDTWFSALTKQEQAKVLKRIRSIDGWDVTPLAEFIDGQKAQFGVENWAPRTVSVGKEVHYAHEVNYFFWGALNATASKNGHGNTRSNMMNWVTAYRRFVGDVLYSFWDKKEHDGTLAGRVRWAEAGWDYIKESAFESPSDVKISGAEATATEYTGSFSVFVGGNVVARD